MLRPCPGCRRHVAGEPACPFCGIALPPREPPHAIVHGRFSRAAVFAGATLAGCWSGRSETTPEHRDTPIEHHQVTHAPDATGTIEGVFKDRTTSAPVSNATIELSSSTAQSRTTQTDVNGHYVFTHVAPGSYRIIYDHDRRNAPIGVPVTVHDGAEQVDLYYDPPVRSNIPMPYGAPPARRRFV